MGRLKIKKKEAVIPFRETLAYRMILVTASVIGFLIALYVMIGALQAGITISFVAAAITGVVAAFFIFYNLDRLRFARIPKRTADKLKRR